MSLVRGGYEVAFDEIVRRYGRALARYAAAIVGGRSEDVTQDAFSKALVALRRSDAEIDLRPWLFRIVRNTALNDLRDRPPSSEVLVEAIAGGRSPAEELERREEIADLIKRLQALPEPQRAAIVMRELEGLSHEEIAAALGLSGGAARQAIYRARQALRDGLGMLLPLPLLRALVEHGGEAAGAGTGTVGGAAVATGAAAGGGGALKAGAVVAVLAGSVGTGIALHEGGDTGRPETAAVEVSRPLPTPAATPPASPSLALDGGEDSSSAGDRGGDGPTGKDQRHGRHRDSHGAGHDGRRGRHRGRRRLPPGPLRPRHGERRRGDRRGPGGGGRRPRARDFTRDRAGRRGGEEGELDARPRDDGRLRDGGGSSWEGNSGPGDRPPPPPPDEEPLGDGGNEYESREAEELSP